MAREVWIWRCILDERYGIGLSAKPFARQMNNQIGAVGSPSFLRP